MFHFPLLSSKRKGTWQFYIIIFVVVIIILLVALYTIFRHGNGAYIPIF